MVVRAIAFDRLTIPNAHSLLSRSPRPSRAPSVFSLLSTLSHRQSLPHLCQTSDQTPRALRQAHARRKPCRRRKRDGRKALQGKRAESGERVEWKEERKKERKRRKKKRGKRPLGNSGKQGRKSRAPSEACFSHLEKSHGAGVGRRSTSWAARDQEAQIARQGLDAISAAGWVVERTAKGSGKGLGSGAGGAESAQSRTTAQAGNPRGRTKKRGNRRTEERKGERVGGRERKGRKGRKRAD